MKRAVCIMHDLPHLVHALAGYHTRQRIGCLSNTGIASNARADGREYDA